MESVNGIKNKLDFKVIAWVINPDHFHMIIDPKKNNLSEIVKRIKLSFSKKYKYRHSIGPGRIWQNRFWDHIIRNETDFNRHIDYIHFNPVKHNLVKSPFQYKFSSIHKFRNFYEDDWGAKTVLKFEEDYGE